jgi:hypothetical protein
MITVREQLSEHPTVPTQDRSRKMLEEPAIGSLWRHVKRGSTYTVRCMCIVEAAMVTSVCYQSTGDGTSWVRPLSEFMDGRFEKLEP